MSFWKSLFGGGTPAPAPRDATNPLPDPAAFFAEVRRQFGKLDQKQVEGFNAVLAALAGWPIAWIAYGLATAWLETARTMQPVREAYWLSERWRKANLRYWPWYGRGYVQLTWEENYRKADEALGLGGALLKDRDLAMRPDLAARIMRRGMEEGWFAADKKGRHNLTRHLPESGPGASPAFREARRIINGVDRRDDIAAFAMQFQAALVRGGSK